MTLTIQVLAPKHAMQYLTSLHKFSGGTRCRGQTCHGFGAAAGAEWVPMAIGNDATPSGLMLLLLVLVMLMMVVAVLVMVLVMLVMALLVYWML